MSDDGAVIPRSIVLRGQVRGLLDDAEARLAAAGIKRLVEREEGQPTGRSGRVLPRELRDLACDVLGHLGMPVLVDTLVHEGHKRETQLEAVRILVTLGPGARTGRDEVGDDEVPGVVLLPEPEVVDPDEAHEEDMRGLAQRPRESAADRAVRLRAMLLREEQNR